MRPSIIFATAIAAMSLFAGDASAKSITVGDVGAACAGTTEGAKQGGGHWGCVVCSDQRCDDYDCNQHTGKCQKTFIGRHAPGGSKPLPGGGANANSATAKGRSATTKTGMTGGHTSRTTK
jgi:hypothetical protein